MCPKTLQTGWNHRGILAGNPTIPPEKEDLGLSEIAPPLYPPSPAQTTCWEPELYRTYGGKLSAWIITEM